MVHLLLVVIYIAFVSLGLPDALLGSAWPVMHQEFSVPVSYAGMISMIIAASTVFSSLQSDRLTKRFGTERVMVVSVAMTAAALGGFSMSSAYWMLCLLAVPYGLGAGSVDAALNNYVALHYASRHMSWLHCMWGVGASIGPYIMEGVLTGGGSWQGGYRIIMVLQIFLTLLLVFSLPVWKRAFPESTDSKENPAADRKISDASKEALSLGQIFAISGAKEVMLMFFCYCALEQTAGLWAGSYLTLGRGVQPQLAAGLAGLFFYGITAGRAVCGFFTMKFSDKAMIRAGQMILAVGVFLLLLPFGKMPACVGLVLLGLGCAPIYPCVIHSTPYYFGADKSQAVIGVQMACAYVGTCMMPPLFGLIAQYVSIQMFPVYLLCVLALMVWMHEQLIRRMRQGQKKR